MQTVRIVGIDPGLVHTGAVSLLIAPVHQTIRVYHHVVDGVTPGALLDLAGWMAPNSDVFIEGYRPRHNLSSDARMVEAVAKIKALTKGTVLLNTGVKKVVRQPLMELLKVWSFSTPTHHQDLRSAARIMLLGMLKEDSHNALLTRIVSDHVDGKPWTVTA